MFMENKMLLVFWGLCMLQGVAQPLIAQNQPEWGIGAAVAGEEAFYMGGYSRFSLPLGDSPHHFRAGLGINFYFDFVGEATVMARLESDVDMRIIPHIFLAYNFRLGNFDLAVEAPLGASIAITQGKLVNERIGFERTYRNSETFWHYGLAFSPTYQIAELDKIGLYAFFPLVIDRAWTAPLLGLGYTKKIELED